MEARISRWLGLAAVSFSVMACQYEGKTAFAEIGPEGGVVESPLGARLVVPPGALERKTLIWLVNEPEPAVAELSISVGPPGLAFARDAYLELRYSPTASQDLLALYVSTPSGWMAAPSQKRQPDRQLFAAPIRGAGAFALIEVSQVPGGALCPPDSMPDGGYPYPADDGGYFYGDDDGGNWRRDGGDYWPPDGGLPACGSTLDGGWSWPDGDGDWGVAPWCGGWFPPWLTCTVPWPRPDGGPFQWDAG